jgi:hypothetical protein
LIAFIAVPFVSFPSIVLIFLPSSFGALFGALFGAGGIAASFGALFGAVGTFVPFAMM